MSAIGGVFRLDGAPVLRAELDALGRALRRRGPDGTRTVLDGSLGLAHARLDVGENGCASHVHRDEASGRIALLDGCLDPEGGAAAVLRAYDRWGADAPLHLHGDFTFAVWDPAPRRLLLVRDAVGARPLYVTRGEGFVAFASLPSALLAFPEVSPRINEARIADYLLGELEGVDHRSTFFAGIERLPPGRRLEVAGGRVCESAWWTLDPAGPLRLASDEAYVEAFLDVFRPAVRCRIREGDRVGVMLSGGVDSGFVTGVARSIRQDALSGDVRAFTALSASADACPEGPHVRALVAQGGITSLTIEPPELDQVWGAVGAAYAETDDLFDDNVLAGAAFLFARARREGVHALLTGVDGDLVATRDVEALGCAVREGRVLDALREAEGLARYQGESRPAGWRLLLRHGLGPLLPSPLRGLARLVRRRDPAAVDLEASLIDPDFACRIGVRERYEAMAKSTWPFPEGAHPPPWTAHARVCGAPFVAAALERYDRVGAALGVEARHPLLDRRVVEFCVALPWDQKQRGGWTKSILRRAARGYLPEATRLRRAASGNVADEYARAVFRMLEPKLLAAVPEALERTASYVDVESVRQSVGRFRDHGNSEAGWNLWSILRLAEWLERRRVQSS